MQTFDWQLADHFAVPDKRLPPTDVTAADCIPVSFQGPDFQGAATSCFAWLGLPAGASAGAPVPGVVLVHGGLGTAYSDWVRLWTSRGYAAIAIDHGGCVPVELDKHVYRRLPDGGPENCGGFPQAGLPPHDRWNFHAVANVIRSHSLLRSLPEVDSDRTAITGISWGGYLTCLTAALDDRFRCAVPVYGCGHIADSPLIGPRVAELGEERAGEWSELWDPTQYLPRIDMPVCFINGTNDRHFIPPMWSPSTLLPAGPVHRSFQIGLQHSQESGAVPAEIPAFIDAHLRGADQPAQLGAITLKNGLLQASCDRQTGQAELLTTNGTDGWAEREWMASPAAFADTTIEAALPADATAACLSTTEADGTRFTSSVWLAR